MGREALIADLRRKAAADAEAVWRDARAAAEKYRLDAGQEVAARRAAVERDAAETARKLERDAVAAADRRARELRAATLTALAGRLHAVALAQLPMLRQAAPEPMFAGLADELPPGDWRRLRVHTLDAGFARERFPGAAIICDDSIRGGMDVEAGDGRVLVRNTLETRLEVAWPDILPGLVAEVLDGLDGHGTAA